MDVWPARGQGLGGLAFLRSPSGTWGQALGEGSVCRKAQQGGVQSRPCWDLFNWGGQRGRSWVGGQEAEERWGDRAGLYWLVCVISVGSGL